MRTSLSKLAHRKSTGGDPIVMVTAYDYTSAKLVERSAVDVILVGDSLGNVMLGHDSTLPVTVEAMIHHASSVVRGTSSVPVVVDLPFVAMATEDDAVRAATGIMAETGAQSVKLEGGAHMVPLISRLVQAGIPVMGHLGFTPQSVNTLGLKVQGKDEAAAVRLLTDALAIQKAGVWGMVLELVPTELAEAIGSRLDVPTIGIGGGPGCDGQVQVWQDLLGLDEDFTPRHARHFGSLGAAARSALDTYAAEVQARTFPAEANVSHLDPEVLARALARVPSADHTAE
ncbi:MAG: 3-methyl-2-oxobutanoate hydroxymethyltransferase [Galactobacter sp.]